MNKNFQVGDKVIVKGSKIVREIVRIVEDSSTPYWATRIDQGTKSRTVFVSADRLTHA